MKTKIRILISVLLAFVMLIPAFSSTVFAQEAETKTILADELFDLFFAEDTNLTPEERNYLRSREDLKVTYSTADVTASLIEVTNEATTGLLEIKANEVEKTIAEGIKVIWTPKSIALAYEGTAPISQDLNADNSYTYRYTVDPQNDENVWHSGDNKITFTVTYALNISLSAAIADKIQTAALSDAIAHKAQIDEDFQEQSGKYNEYIRLLGEYNTEHPKWVERNNAYTAYTTLLEQYNQAVADYNALSAKWDAYNQYIAAKPQNDADWAAYNTPYGETMEEVNACLAIMESMFDAGEGEYSFYQSLKGESNNKILNNLDILKQKGANSIKVNNAKSKIASIISILDQYNEKMTAVYGTDFEKAKELFQFYQENYDDLCDNLNALHERLIEAFTDTVKAELEDDSEVSASVPLFQSFLGEVGALYTQLAAKSDSLDLEFPETYKEPPAVLEPVEEPEELGDEPVHPDVVAAPGNEPVQPEVVAYPGEAPDYTQLSTEERALLDKYDAEDIPQRTGTANGVDKREEYEINISNLPKITKTISYLNKRTVTFKDKDGTLIPGFTLTEEYGTDFSEITTPNKEAYNYSNQDTTYTCIGWRKDKTNTEFTGKIKENLVLKPFFSEKKRKYDVFWDYGNGKVIKQEQEYEYGQNPVPPEAPTHENNEVGDYIYIFDDWYWEQTDQQSGETIEIKGITSVKNNVTYYVKWIAAPRVCKITFQLWEGNSKVVSVPYNQLPTDPYQEHEMPSDEVYDYTFVSWSKEIVPATKDDTYLAVWARKKIGQPDDPEILYNITWNLDNGTTPVLIPTYAGDIPSYPATPTKEPDAQYTYEFDKWDPEPVAVTGDATYTAQWKETKREYTITWNLGYEGSTAKIDTLKYGDPLNYGEAPTRPADGDTVYTFVGWEPTPGATVTGEATYTAKWTTDATRYTITWNINGEETTAEYYRGATPVYEGTPTKDQDAQYTYEFKGWSPTLVEVTGNATYTATWDHTLREYTITWRSDNHTILKRETLKYGDLPDYGETPTKSPTADYTYEFDGWNTTPVTVTGNATYTAKWEKTLREYTVTWNLDNGTDPVTDQVAYDEIPAYQGETPVKAPDEQHSYEFDGWDPAPAKVTGNQSYTAKWKPGPRSFDITWDLGYGESATSTVEVMNGETPTPPTDTPTRPDDESFSYTFVDWSPEIAPATAAVTYTAIWEKVPLVKDAEGKTYPTQIVGETVVVDATQNNELGLKTVIDFAAEENKTVTLERKETKLVLQAKSLKEQLPGLYGIRWTEDADAGSFRVEFVDSQDNVLETKLTYQVIIPTVADTRELSVYELDGDMRTKITTYQMESASNCLTYKAQFGKTVIYKIRYKLTIEGTYYTDLPEAAEFGETISLANVKCELGSEIVGATLVYEDGTEETVETSFFTMPAQSLTVKLKIQPIKYHIVFKSNGVILSQKDYNYGETIEVPEDPTLPDENGNKFVFVGWNPQVSQTATGEAKEQVYEARFTLISNPPQEEAQPGFVDSPAFAVLIMVLIVGAVVAVAIVAVVLRMKKKSDDN